MTSQSDVCARHAELRQTPFWQSSANSLASKDLDAPATRKKQQLACFSCSDLNVHVLCGVEEHNEPAGLTSRHAEDCGPLTDISLYQGAVQTCFAFCLCIRTTQHIHTNTWIFDKCWCWSCIYIYIYTHTYTYARCDIPPRLLAYDKLGGQPMFPVLRHNMFRGIACSSQRSVFVSLLVVDLN